jgi:hypothetical protein
VFTSPLVERPATKWPDVFGDFQLFTAYPYLLPCALASFVMLIGSSQKPVFVLVQLPTLKQAGSLDFSSIGTEVLEKGQFDSPQRRLIFIPRFLKRSRLLQVQLNHQSHGLSSKLCNIRSHKDSLAISPRGLLMHHRLRH